MTIGIFYSIIIVKKCVRKLFYRYISENFTNYVNQGELEAGNISFDYIKLLDEEVEHWERVEYYTPQFPAIEQSRYKK